MPVSSVSFPQLRKLCEALENALAISIETIEKLLQSSDKDQIIEQTAHLVLQQLLSLDEHSSVSECIPANSGDLVAQYESGSASTSRPKGSRSLVSMYPQIPVLVTDFLEQDGYSAQSWCCTDVGSACGVTLEDIWQYLIANIPQLKDKWIGQTTLI